MAEVAHAYSPKQYERVTEVWRRLVEIARKNVPDVDLYFAILSDGDVKWQFEENELSFCYSSDHAGSEYDRANARYLADNYSFLGHLDDHGPASESYVHMTLGELPTPQDAGSEQIDDAITELDSLAGDLERLRSDSAVLGDQYLYDLEQEVEEECWDAYFMSEFRAAVADNLGCDEYDLEFDFLINDDQLKKMFYDERVHAGCHFELKNATSGYFEGWEDVAAQVADTIVKLWREVYVDPNQLTLI